MKRMGTIGVLIILASQDVLAAPNWAKTQVHSSNKNIYKTVCSGQGPAVDVARSEAIRSCKLSASEMLNMDVKVNSLSVETERDAAFHREVSETGTIKNLLCNIERDEIEQSQDGIFTVWILCAFDLSRTSLEQEPQPFHEQNQPSNANAHLSTITVKSIGESPPDVTSKSIKTLNIISIPQCADLLIRGGRPRRIMCDTSFTPVPIFEHDETIIVRADRYKPKTIKLKQLPSGGSRDAIQVVLEQD